MRTKLKDERETMAARGMIPAPEAAKKVGVAITTMYRWMDDGKVGGELVSGWRRYVSLASLAIHLGPTMAAKYGIAPSTTAKGVVNG